MTRDWWEYAGQKERKSRVVQQLDGLCCGINTEALTESTQPVHSYDLISHYLHQIAFDLLDWGSRQWGV